MIAICIGHSRSGDSGAVSVGNVTEHTFNTALGNRVADLLSDIGQPVEVISGYEGTSYSRAQQWLGNLLKEKGAILAIELHFNAADSPKAQGFEYLYHENSLRGQYLASGILAAHRSRFVGTVCRGIQPIMPGGRGFEFLRRTPCPAVICEPFFGSNQTEWDLYSTDYGQKTLAEAYAAGIKSFLGIK